MKNSGDDNSNLRKTLELLELPMIDHLGDDEFACVDVKSLIPKLPYKTPVWFSTNCFSLTLSKNAFGHYSTQTNSFDVKPGTFFLQSRGRTGKLNGMKLMRFTSLLLTNASL